MIGIHISIHVSLPTSPQSNPYFIFFTHHVSMATPAIEENRQLSCNLGNYALLERFLKYA